MNVSTITMPAEVAKEKLRTVRKVLHRRADAEFEALERAYAALGEGTPILDVAESLAIGGFDEKGRPRLALARADRRKVRVNERPRPDQPYTFDATTEAQSSAWWGWTKTSTTMQQSFAVVGAPEKSAVGWALIPMIPPHVREDHPASYDRRRFILWEVEAWSDKPLGAKPPVDPMLLEPLEGGLYVVLAHWDLTELERRIMAGRNDA